MRSTWCISRDYYKKQLSYQGQCRIYHCAQVRLSTGLRWPGGGGSSSCLTLYDGCLVMWCNFEFEGVLFTIPTFPEIECMPDCLCRPTGSTSFRTQVRGLICPKSVVVQQTCRIANLPHRIANLPPEYLLYSTTPLDKMKIGGIDPLSDLKSLLSPFGFLSPKDS